MSDFDKFIVVIRETGGVTAYKGDSLIKCDGNTPVEAIGNLIYMNQELFGIKIIMEENKPAVKK